MALLTTQAARKVRSRCMLPPPNCLGLCKVRTAAHGLCCHEDSVTTDCAALDRPKLRCCLGADLTGDSGRQLFPDFYPADLERNHLCREIQNPSRCFITRDSAGVDVRNQISVGVGLS